MKVSAFKFSPNKLNSIHISQSKIPSHVKMMCFQNLFLTKAKESSNMTEPEQKLWERMAFKGADE